MAFFRRTSKAAPNDNPGWYDLPFKTVLYGESKVGKTSLVRRFKSDAFNPNYYPTIGVEIAVKSCVVDDVRCGVQLWDPDVTRLDPLIFIRGASGVMLVYDASSRDSFESVKTWLERIVKATTTELAIILVGNKCDREEAKSVSYETGKTLATEHGIKYFTEVSAKTGENVEEAFVTLIACCKMQWQKARASTNAKR